MISLSDVDHGGAAYPPRLDLGLGYLRPAFRTVERTIAPQYRVSIPAGESATKGTRRSLDRRRPPPFITLLAKRQLGVTNQEAR
jgi:hypothetical protein